MALGGGERRTTQHHLIDHELAVIFAERALDRTIAGVRQVSAPRPLPDDAEGIGNEAGASRDFPFLFAWQVLARPARVSVGLVIAHMTNGRGGIDRLRAAERHLLPRA